MLQKVHVFRLNDGPNTELVDVIKLVGTGLSLVCCLVIRGSTGGFFCSGISVVLFHTLGISRCHNSLFLSNSHITDLIYDLFDPVLIH